MKTIVIVTDKGLVFKTALTAKEVAKMLDVSVNQVYKFARTGVIPDAVKFNGIWYFERNNVIAFRKSRWKVKGK